MNIWDGESWEELMKAPSNMVDCGPLYGPVDTLALLPLDVEEKVEISRSKKLIDQQAYLSKTLKLVV
jgi:hypothetical protein